MSNPELNPEPHGDDWRRERPATKIEERVIEIIENLPDDDSSKLDLFHYATMWDGIDYFEDDFMQGIPAVHILASVMKTLGLMDVSEALEEMSQKLDRMANEIREIAHTCDHLNAPDLFGYLGYFDPARAYTLDERIVKFREAYREYKKQYPERT